MSTATLGPRSETKVAHKLVAVGSANPIKWWAAAGAFCLALQAYVFVRWIISGNASPTRSGPDAIPSWMTLAARTYEIAGVALMIGAIYFVVIKPWRRDRRIGIPGLLVLAMPTSYWLELALNYFNHSVTYNTAFINLGAWYNFIPGWTSPRANHLAEPLVAMLPIYVWGLVPPAMLIAALMRKAKAKWPQIGAVGLLLIGGAAAFAVDLVLETLWLRVGLYSYVGAVPSLTLFHGNYYQFPLYEALLATLYWLTIGAVLYFRDDKGNTILQRGEDRLKVSRSQRTFVRFLAFVTFASLINLLYGISMAAFSLFPTFGWADDVVQNRSYLRDELCGAGTTYACPSADLPIPRRGGAHIAPNHALVPG